MNEKNTFSCNEKCEDLLSTWLSLSATVRNERLVQGMTFREILLCNVIYNETLAGHEVTATDIVKRTGILKSQMNKIIVSMESRDLIKRVSSPSDKRRLLLLLSEKGEALYQKEHVHILTILDQLIQALGTKKTAALIDQLNEVTFIMQRIIEKGEPNNG